jgi:uncharacterized membrane protein YecN with MAPEG domain
MNTAIVCTALLGGLLFALSIRTSMLRGKAGPDGQVPTAPDDPLFVAIRAHGNAAENAAMLAVLMLLVGSRDPATWTEVVMVVVTAARFAHAFGVIQGGDMRKEAPLRLAGAIVTTLAGLALCVAAVVSL